MRWALSALLPHRSKNIMKYPSLNHLHRWRGWRDTDTVRHCCACAATHRSHATHPSRWQRRTHLCESDATMQFALTQIMVDERNRIQNPRWLKYHQNTYSIRVCALQTRLIKFAFSPSSAPELGIPVFPAMSCIRFYGMICSTFIPSTVIVKR